MPKAISIDYEGVHFDSILAFCAAYELKPAVLCARKASYGGDLEKAIEHCFRSKENGNSKGIPVEFHGKKYDSIEKCIADTGISKSRYSTFRREGMSPVQALEAAWGYEPAGFVFDGEKYENVTDCCLKLGLNPKDVMNRRRRKGWDYDSAIRDVIENPKGNPQAVKKEPVPVEINGIRYDSLSACCNALDIPYKRVTNYRIKHPNESPESTIKACLVNMRRRHRTEPVTWQGKTYASLYACCCELGLNYKAIWRRRNAKNCTAEEAIAKYFKFQANPPIYPRAEAVNVRGKRYNSIKECCNAKDLNQTEVSRIKAIYGFNSERAIEHCLKRQERKQATV